MEYKAFKFLHRKAPKNILIKKLISYFFIILGSVIFLIPLPFSVPTGLLIAFSGIILRLKSVKEVKYLIKIKKSILFMMKNFHKKDIISLKIRDIKRLYRKIG